MLSPTKIFLSGLVLLVTCLSLSAQDVITLRNGDEIESKVQEVTQNEIKYKKFDNLDGPLYTINKSEVFMIKYENGERDVFEESPSSTMANYGNFTMADIQNAEGKAKFGFISIAPVMLGAIAAALVDDGTVIGGITTVYYAASVPITASGANKLRNKSGVEGHSGLRLAGWLAYGLGLTDALVAVGLGASDIYVPEGVVISIGLIGSGSLALLASEGNMVAQQARNLLSAKNITVKPNLGISQTHVSGRSVPTVGFRVEF